MNVRSVRNAVTRFFFVVTTPVLHPIGGCEGVYIYSWGMFALQGH